MAQSVAKYANVWKCSLPISVPIHPDADENSRPVERCSATGPSSGVRRKYVLSHHSLSSPTHIVTVVVHGSELSYLLQTGLYTNVSTADKILARGFQTSYISFAHFLDPNQIKGAPQWPKYTPGDDQVLVWQNPDANSVGIHAEHDQEDNAACAYIDANPGAFIR